MNLNWQSAIILLGRPALLVIIAIFIAVFPFNSSWIVVDHPDTRTFLNFYRGLASGYLNGDSGDEKISFAMMHVGPLYPVFLGVAASWIPDLENAIRILHTVIGLATIFYVTFCLKNLLPAAFSASSVLTAQVFGYPFFCHGLSEWISLNLFMGAVATLVRLSHTRSLLDVFTLMLFSSALPLARAAFSLAAPAFLFLAFLAAGRKAGAFLLAAILGLSPLIGWIGYNYIRLNDIGVITTSGNTFAVAISMQAASVPPGSTPLLRDFITQMNEMRWDCSGRSDKNPQSEYCINRSAQLAFAFGRERSLPLKVTERLMSQYANAVFDENPWVFAEYAWNGFKPPLKMLVLSLIAIVFTVLRRSPDVNWRIPLCGCLAIVWLYLITCSACVVIIARYSEFCTDALVFVCGIAASLYVYSPIAVKNDLNN